MTDDTKLISKLKRKIVALQAIINAYRQAEAARNNRKPLVYVAQPFGGKQENFIRAERTLIQCVETYPQYDFISPIIAYGFCYNVYSYETGINQCLALLSRCDALWIYNTGEPSKGVAIEREWAITHNMTIKEITE